MLRTMEGGCHCGRVRFRVTADLASVSDCNCSICTKKGMLHLIVPPERFALLSGKEELTTYEFNTGTAKHTFCKHCGIHPFYVPRSDPGGPSMSDAETTTMKNPAAKSSVVRRLFGDRIHM